MALLAGTAAAQERVELRGEVVLADGSPAAGVPLSLQVHNGTTFVYERAEAADGDGVARFGDVPVGAGFLARLAALYDGVSYYSEPLDLEQAGPGATLRVQVAAVTSDGRPLHLDTLHVIVQAETPTAFRVLQFVTVSNAGEAAWAGGPALPDGSPSGLTIPLPRGAIEVVSAPFPSAADALPAERIAVGPDRVLDPRPVPPSGRQAAVTYALRAENGPLDVALTLPYPTQTVSVLLGGPAAAGVALERTNLERQPDEAIGGETYQLWTATALDPGVEVRFRLGAPGGPLLPAYGWALAGLGGMFLLAIGGRLFSRPAGRDTRLRDEILERIARLDLEKADGRLEDAAYHLARGRELERLLLLEARQPPGGDLASDRVGD